MQEVNVVESIDTDTLATPHKLAIFLLGNLAAFAATLLVEKGYVAGLVSWRLHKATYTK